MLYVSVKDLLKPLSLQLPRTKTDTVTDRVRVPGSGTVTDERLPGNRGLPGNSGIIIVSYVTFMSETEY